MDYGITIEYTEFDDLRLLSEDHNVKISFDHHLTALFGIGEIELRRGESRRVFIHSHLDHPSPMFTVHCNIVKPYQYKRWLLPGLRTFLPPSEEQLVMENFVEPKWLPALEGVFYQLETSITDELGKEVNFRGYPVDVELKVRPIKGSYELE